MLRKANLPNTYGGKKMKKAKTTAKKKAAKKAPKKYK
jgi:hypothetical protein